MRSAAWARDPANQVWNVGPPAGSTAKPVSVKPSAPQNLRWCFGRPTTVSVAGEPPSYRIR